MSPLKVERAYHHCEECGSGIVRKDAELDIVGTSFSPGVRRLMGRVGAKEPFAQGQQDLEELAAVVVHAKEVERVSESLGAEIEVISQQGRKLALFGRLLCFQRAPKLFIAMDGTGVPLVPQETEGRAGKDSSGKAKTREAKLVCIFTQTTLDAKARQAFTTEQRVDVLIRSVGLEPAALTERAKKLAILRMVPFVERNYNLVELGPKGTGKSNLFRQSSPHAHLSLAARPLWPRCL